MRMLLLLAMLTTSCIHMGPEMGDYVRHKGFYRSCCIAVTGYNDNDDVFHGEMKCKVGDTLEKSAVFFKNSSVFKVSKEECTSLIR